VVKHVFFGVNAQGTRVTSFKVPTEEERAHDFLWRIHKAIPGHGEIGIFNRSHYEEVLVVRVHELVPEKVWRKRYDDIRHFEDNLVDSGVSVVKLYLHISKGEQAERLQARLDDPTKHWKFNVGDLDDRARWPQFMAAYEEAVNRTSTKAAPWYVIPADHKWYRDWAVSHILIDTLEAMDPQYPEPEDDLGKVVIE
jgi:PPK2 family polyphosphate:nucleotide phosphotransferase